MGTTSRRTPELTKDFPVNAKKIKSDTSEKLLFIFYALKVSILLIAMFWFFSRKWESQVKEKLRQNQLPYVIISDSLEEERLFLQKSLFSNNTRLCFEMYIYEIPYRIRQRLVDVLNVNDAWRDLAGTQLGYDQVSWSTCLKNSTHYVVTCIIELLFHF